VGKAARIRRERAAKAQAAPAEDGQLLSVFDIADLDGLERYLEQHPRLTNAATIASVTVVPTHRIIVRCGDDFSRGLRSAADT
jgi:hypothetical protein